MQRPSFGSRSASRFIIFRKQGMIPHYINFYNLAPKPKPGCNKLIMYHVYKCLTVCQQYVNDSPMMKLDSLRSHDRHFATSKTQLWNVPTPTPAFVKQHQGEEEGEATAKNVGAPKTEIIVPGALVCAKRKLCGNFRDDKSEDTQNANCIAGGEKVPG